MHHRPVPPRLRAVRRCLRHARQALAIRERIADEHGVASALNLVALVEWRLGRHAAARRDAERALALQRRMKAGYGLGRR